VRGALRAPAATGREGAATPWVVNEPSTGRLTLPAIGELLRYRELALALALRDLQVRYKQTFFGVAWAIVQPLAATGALTLVFNGLADLESGDTPYAVFVLAGMVGWAFFSAGVSRCTGSVAGNDEMVTKVYFPRLLLCLAAVLPGFADLLVGLALFGGALAVTGTGVSLAILALPAVLAMLFLLTFGIGCLLAAVNVRYRDVGNAVPLLLQIWLFISPVAYASELAGDSDLLYHLNPMAGMIDLFRWSLLGDPVPGSECLVSLGVGLVLLVAGLWTFGRMERRFADVI
jgi:lipopolysaccharide transport system permease protein